MKTFEIILIIMLFLVILIGIISHLRNEAVYRYRIGLIRRDFNLYKKMPPYQEMFIKFWIPLKDKYWTR